MPIYELTPDAIRPIDQVTLASQGIKERQDLQRILRTHIATVSQDTYILAEEFGEWAESKRSIDLLGLDKNANLVVIELKRTEDGGHMELQSLRYAAMVSKMTFAQAVDAHSNFLDSIDRDPNEAESEILKFLEWDEPLEAEFAQDVRIVLVSADFSKEITTSVLWLNERELDIRCVRLRPYKLNEKILLDIQQVVPLPESAAYQIQIREKAAEERQSQERNSDWTRYDLRIGDTVFPSLFKRHLFLRVVLALVKSGVSVANLAKYLPNRKFSALPGKLEGTDFRNQISQMKNSSGNPYDLRRRFVEDDELFFSDGKTWALSNQWSRYQLPLLDSLIAEYPQFKISYSKAHVTEG